MNKYIPKKKLKHYDAHITSQHIKAENEEQAIQKARKTVRVRES